MRKELRALVVAAAMIAPLGGGVSALAATAQKNQEPQTEQQITREARHQLLLLPYYTVFDNLSYQVNGDTVILQGQVVRPTLKSDAEAAVKSVSGVNKVVNNIQVLPVSPMDDQLRRAEFRAIYSEPSLSKYGWSALPTIHIIVNNGHVTLVGVVDNEGDKNLAGLRANQVPNVFSVTNDLRVQGANGGGAR